MDLLRQARSNSRIAALVLVFLLSFSLYGLYCINTVSEVKINGPYYKRIVQGKDVIADILPPPQYLIEAYLTAHQMLEADSADLDILALKSARLEQDYEARHAFWVGDLPSGDMKEALTDESYAPARRMLDAMKKDFLPALRAGDRAKAQALLEGEIGREYAHHRSAIDKVVAMAVKRNQEDEARAGVAVQSRTYGQIALGILLFFLLSIFSSYVVQKGDKNGKPGHAEEPPTGEKPRSNPVPGQKRIPA